MRRRIPELAQRVTPKAVWNDVVLPEQERLKLHEIVARVANREKAFKELSFKPKSSRGLGVTALFTGSNGTAKNTAAEALANQLHLDLFRIDLSVVFSKYIGETEKNLRRLFDAAEDCGVVLFFDEADALFGKRTEVRDSHDRYANTIIDYLLQGMEDYRGLSILATNSKQNLDPAFIRRIQFAVNFES